MTLAEESSERQRLAALDELELLEAASGTSDERFDRVVRLAQKIFGVPMVAVNLIGADSQVTKAGVGIEGSIPRAEAFCDHTIRGSGPVVVSDARLDPRFADNPRVAGDEGIRFYAGQPLAAPGGERIGALCLVSHEPREISDAELSMLRDLADWVEKELSHDDDLAQASAAQRSLLPSRPPDSDAYDVAGRCLPARHVGGDFYDWFLLGDGAVQVVVADVMGKGVGAAIIAATVRAVLRGASLYNELPEAVNRSGRSLAPDLEQTSTFVTAFTARFDPVSGTVRYVDAGHGLAAVLGPGRTFRTLVSDDLPLGVLGEGEWHAEEVVLAPGEALVVVSDGFLDAFEDPREGWHVLAGLYSRSGSAAELVDEVVTLTGSRVEDDLTVVVVRRRD
ncbi:SpoIIE family protein phosphatase [Nocardioides ferulae]|uniref:SpoIIE family protein phosphatase n=1 Tax=Nocardioides ferulae TaxID=2340821 RepID=UPI00197E2369|nr:SpoIIE family protein phosphatase [Nocardioides ferulae]